MADDGARRADIEDWLARLGVKWRFEEQFEIDKIDWFGSLSNQARLKAIDTEVVERYTADMLRGDQFPPVLLRQKGGATQLAGGIHRIAAAKAAEKTAFPAYLLKADPGTLTRVMYEDNHRHGLPPTEDERCLQAAHLVQSGFCSAKEAAAIVGLTPTKAARAAETASANSRAVTVGIFGWGKLASTTRWRLGGIRYDSVFEKVANLAVRAALVSDLVFDLVAAVNAAPTEEEALAVAAEAEQLHAGANGSVGSRRRTARARVIAAADRIVTIDVDDVVLACDSNADRAQLRDRVRQCGLVLDEILTVLEAQ